MGIDIRQLAPWAQKQIAEKAVKQAQEREKKRKYNNTPATRKSDCGAEIRFDSQKEARRYDELMVLAKAGKIRNLRLQPQFTLKEAYTTVNGTRIRAMRYQADFSYEKPFLGEDIGIWETVVEDVKSRATKTRVYAMKKKLLLEQGIEIVEVE